MRLVYYGELEKLATGSKPRGLKDKLAGRAAQLDAAAHAVLPDMFVGAPEIALRKPRRGGGRARPATKPRQLTGLGVSGGVATGRARIVPDVVAMADRDIDDGEILIAPFTDAPWTPLFIPAAAVVVETGGVLSHAATVAREFGIPCVVMVKDATTIIRDGQTVTVDGTAGTVTVAAAEPARV
jgi:pyruvate,water dikinase